MPTKTSNHLARSRRRLIAASPLFVSVFVCACKPPGPVPTEGGCYRTASTEAQLEELAEAREVSIDGELCALSIVDTELASTASLAGLERVLEIKISGNSVMTALGGLDALVEPSALDIEETPLEGPVQLPTGITSAWMKMNGSPATQIELAANALDNVEIVGGLAEELTLQAATVNRLTITGMPNLVSVVAPALEHIGALEIVAPTALSEAQIDALADLVDDPDDVTRP